MKHSRNLLVEDIWFCQAKYFEHVSMLFVLLDVQYFEEGHDN